MELDLRKLKSLKRRVRLVRAYLRLADQQYIKVKMFDDIPSMQYQWAAMHIRRNVPTYGQKMRLISIGYDEMQFIGLMAPDLNVLMNNDALVKRTTMGRVPLWSRVYNVLDEAIKGRCPFCGRKWSKECRNSESAQS